MARWHKIGQFVERAFKPFRKSRRTTMTALVAGLPGSQRVGLANIARGMKDYTTIKHRVKRIGRFLANKSVESWLATECLIGFLIGQSWPHGSDDDNHCHRVRADSTHRNGQHSTRREFASINQ